MLRRNFLLHFTKDKNFVLEGFISDINCVELVKDIVTPLPLQHVAWRTSYTQKYVIPRSLSQITCCVWRIKKVSCRITMSKFQKFSIYSSYCISNYVSILKLKHRNSILQRQLNPAPLQLLWLWWLSWRVHFGLLLVLECSGTRPEKLKFIYSIQIRKKQDHYYVKLCKYRVPDKINFFLFFFSPLFIVLVVVFYEFFS